MNVSNTLLRATYTPEQYLDAVFPRILAFMLRHALHARETPWELVNRWEAAYDPAWDMIETTSWIVGWKARRKITGDVRDALTERDYDEWILAVLNPANRVGRWK